MGVETEAFTLQYSQPSKSMKAEVAEDSSSVHNYAGNINLDNLAEHFSGFDIVHLHCPFLGMARKIIDWKKLHPSIPLVVTYYRDVRVEDMFSIFIKLYNAYYVPKIFALASVVVCYNFESFRKTAGFRSLHDTSNVAILDEVELGEEGESLKPAELVAAKTLAVYNSLRSDE